MAKQRRNSIRHKHPPNPGSSAMKQNELSWLGRFNHSVITQIHCLILVYQQFRNWYWHPPGQFLCQVMVFEVPLKPLDNDCLPGWTQTGQNGKNKWVKQYTMIIIACCLQKFRKENWGYRQWNNHFWLNTNFCRLFFIIFQGSSQFSGYFRDLFRGMNHFRGFSWFSGVADHPVLATNMAYRSCLTSCQTT